MFGERKGNHEVDMKKISILVPCYNEAENVVPMSQELVKIMEERLSQYDYELLFNNFIRIVILYMFGQFPFVKCLTPSFPIWQ